MKSRKRKKDKREEKGEDAIYYLEEVQPLRVGLWLFVPRLFVACALWGGGC